MIPASASQLLVALVFVMPGFVFQAVRLWLRGQLPGEREQFGRALSALGISVVFGLIYFAVIGHRTQELWSNPTLALSRPIFYAATALTLIFAIPFAAAIIDHYVYLRGVERSGGMGWLRASGAALKTLFTPAAYRIYNSSPSAWDYAARRLEPDYIRVQMADGLWLGGYFGGSGFINATPEPREIYVEQAWILDHEGKFIKPVNHSRGAWINCRDAVQIDYLKTDSGNEEEYGQQTE